MSQTQITNGLPGVINPQGNTIDDPIEKKLGIPATRRSAPALDFQYRREVNSDEGPIRSAEESPPGSNLLKIDPAVLISLVTVAFNRLEKNQIEAFSNELEKAQPRAAKTLDSMIAKIEEQARKQNEIKEKEKKNQIASDVQLGLGAALTVLGILATILSAGALSPLIGIGMAIGATMTGADIVNRGLKAGKVQYDDPLAKSGNKKTPLDISIGGLVKMAVEKAAASGDFAYPDEVRKKGPEAMEKYRNQVIMGVSMFISIAVAGLTIALSVGGIVSLRNAAKAASDGAGLAKDAATSTSKLAKFAEANSAQIQMVNQVSQVAADGTNLGLTIYQNVNGIGMAETKYSMDLASAEANRLQTTSDILESYVNNIKSTIKNVTESINQSKALLADAQKNADASASNSASVI
jgi:hypothetical protein